MKRLLFFILLICAPILAQQSMLTINYTASFEEHWLFTDAADTINGSWSHLDSMPVGLYGVTSYYWPDSNKIFLCGGSTSSAVMPNCYFYDIVSNTYQTKAPLPTGRALGKLVRVRDSLYLVGSVGSNFFSPDGALYKYDPGTNLWVTRTSMPSPYLQESAVCVYGDSIIYVIGGSSSGFTGSSNLVRFYKPSTNSWYGTTNNFPVNITTSHAECIDKEIVVLGGFSALQVREVYRGTIDSANPLIISWRQADTLNPFGIGVYRPGGGRWSNYMLFGPALRNSTPINQIWGFNIADSTWRRFEPNTLDSAANRPSIAIRSLGDSVYFYLFGGILNGSLYVTSKSERYAFYNSTIGIQPISNEIPEKFSLSQNYPNPFNPKTIISFNLPENSKSKLIVYDLLGREVEILINEELKAGIYEVIWDASIYPSGVYFYRMISDNYIKTKKMILLK